MVLVLTAAGVAFCDSVEAVVLLPPVEDRWLVMTAAAASILSGGQKKTISLASLYLVLMRTNKTFLHIEEMKK